MNWFAYADGDPVMKFDPNGLDALYLWTENPGEGKDPRFFERVAKAHADLAARNTTVYSASANYAYSIPGEPRGEQHIARFSDLPKLAERVSNITSIQVYGHSFDYQSRSFNLNSVPTRNIASNARITLYGCNAGSGKNCSGQRFADYFQRTTFAPPGGVTFGYA